MAHLAAMTPQQSFVAPQASPQHHHHQPHATPHGLPSNFSQSFSMPYDGSPHAHPPAQPQSQPAYSQSFPNGPISNPGYARSFGDGYGSGRNFGGKPQIYTVGQTKPPGILETCVLILLCRPSTPGSTSMRWRFQVLPACAGAATAGSTPLKSSKLPA